MKRNAFLRLFTGTGIALLASKDSLNRIFESWRGDKGFWVKAGKDRFDHSITLYEGDTFYTKVSSKDTNGSQYVYESSRQKKGGPALHTHYEQDEWWYVLEGEFLIKVGDETYAAKVGDSVFGPRGVPHAFAKTNEGNARLLMIFQPAGKMEEWFQLVSEGKLAKLSEKEQQEQRKLHGFERVGPAIDYLKQ